MLEFDMPKERSSIIKVIGVGGGGSNAVTHMYKQGIEGVDFVICNTDQQALEQSPVPNKIALGQSLTNGLGAGSHPDVGRKATEESVSEILEMLSGKTKMVFVTAGMGGGTGTGGGPELAKAAKEAGYLTVGIVTSPFKFEGRRRLAQAKEGIERMRENVDCMIVISNDKLRELYGDLGMSEAFGKADDILTRAAKGISEIITVPGYINVDFEDVKTVMKDSGVAIMGAGTASGPDRAIDSVVAALESPLLSDNNIKGAKSILLNIASGMMEATMDEITTITDYIYDEVGSETDLIWGNCTDESLGDSLVVTLIATGFSTDQNKPGPKITPLNATIKRTELNTEYSETETSTEPSLVNPKNDYHESDKNEVEPITFNLNDPESFQDETTDEADDNKATANDEFFVIKSTDEVEETPPEEPVFASEAEKEILQKKAQERYERLKMMSMKFNNKEKIQELEKEPAFIRRKVNLDKVNHSSESDVSRYTLGEAIDSEKPEIKRNNSFLHDNVD